MSAQTLPGGTYTLADDLTVTRMGYGAMQLAGPGVFGPPADRDGAIAVLREVVDLGINHIDTSDFYGPFVTNEIIREALSPYTADLHLVTKVGALRDAQGGWPHARSPEQLRQAVHDNLKRLGLDSLDVVNLRVGATDVQNMYNIANRGDDELIDSLAAQGIAYVPYFPLGGFSPLQSEALSTVAARLGSAPMAVALAWLLQRSPNILLIPGTSSVDHLRENVSGAALTLGEQDLKELDGIGA
jgi:pyridoxine 4-dehydrogenase